MEEKSTLLRVEKGAAHFRLLLPHPSRSPAGPDLSLEFKVTPEGALGFDNRQPAARFCRNRRFCALLAAEMIRAAQDRVPGSLCGRSCRGVAFELRVHLLCYRLGLLRRHSVTTEIGSVDPAAADYDTNAGWFERPLRGIPVLCKALLRKLFKRPS